MRVEPLVWIGPSDYAVIKLIPASRNRREGKFDGKLNDKPCRQGDVEARENRWGEFWAAVQGVGNGESGGES